MALTLATYHDNFTNPTPAPSRSTSAVLRVPDVYVIPPEEEQMHSPPFCYFDASSAPASETHHLPTVDSLDYALQVLHQSQNPPPLFHRPSEESMETVAMPRRSSVIYQGTSSVDSEWEAAVREVKRHDPCDDSDVVEIIKVRRNEGMKDVSEGKSDTLKKQKNSSLKARASQAFRSIKNVGRGNRRPGVKDVFSPGSGNRSSGESTSHDSGVDVENGFISAVSPEQRQPKLLRRKSRQLANFFTFSPGRSSTSSAHTFPIPSSTSLPSFGAAGSLASRPSYSSNFEESAMVSSMGEEMRSPTLVPPEGMERPVSPSPSMKRSGTFRKRLSVLNLHRVFSFSLAEPEPASSISRPVPVPYSIPPPPTPDAPSIQYSPSITSEAQDSPMGGDPFAITQISSPTLPPLPTSSASFSLLPPDVILTDHDSMDTDTVTRLHVGGELPGGGDPLAEDDEMRLDSLHFDSLHFDADEFQLSLS
ncbi:hypothetical protein JAAARDRAFT_33061 [Jaapia argillacea MUCL 33604]|uniref:Uncharacterized protein n=1 Tax=Jaapia argillacea MUCL 33604 TaxID=933084 RepID=A0A067QA88_9AGAM|nr:hypothetical protein JAAARDRAFT_33061 [Jaapia argillacea MUCL 33604]